MSWQCNNSSSDVTIRAVPENTMSPPGKAIFLNIMWVVVFEIPKCKGSAVLIKFYFCGWWGLKKSAVPGGDMVFFGTALTCLFLSSLLFNLQSVSRWKGSNFVAGLVCFVGRLSGEGFGKGLALNSLAYNTQTIFILIILNIK